MGLRVAATLLFAIYILIGQELNNKDLAFGKTERVLKV